MRQNSNVSQIHSHGSAINMTDRPSLMRHDSPSVSPRNLPSDATSMKAPGSPRSNNHVQFNFGQAVANLN